MSEDRELTQDEVDELEVDAVWFQWRWGRAVRLSDLSLDQRDWLARNRRHVQ